MLPDDRVLVAAVPDPADFERIMRERWYRVPLRHAPKGVYAEWLAFYFGSRYGADKYAIHYVARRLGHELAYRRDLLPEEPDHPRANEAYFKLQLDMPQRLARPIVSLKWRRILFIHTTGDRFLDAEEINDLLIDGQGYVDRRLTALRDEVAPPYYVLNDAPDPDE